MDSGNREIIQSRNNRQSADRQWAMPPAPHNRPVGPHPWFTSRRLRHHRADRRRRHGSGLAGIGISVDPHWTRGGRELVYRNGDAIMAVPIELSPTFRAGTATVLFKGTYFNETGSQWESRQTATAS
jgi:hypothetical protein